MISCAQVFHNTSSLDEINMVKYLEGFMFCAHLVCCQNFQIAVQIISKNHFPNNFSMMNGDVLQVHFTLLLTY